MYTEEQKQAKIKAAGALLEREMREDAILAARLAEHRRSEYREKLTDEEKAEAIRLFVAEYGSLRGRAGIEDYRRRLKAFDERHTITDDLWREFADSGVGGSFRMWYGVSLTDFDAEIDWAKFRAVK